LTGGQPLSLADIQQKVLDDRTVLLEYSLGSEQSYLWVVPQSSAALFKLPARNAIEKLATDFRGQLVPPRLQRRIVGIDIAADQQRGVGLATGAEVAAPLLAAANALYKTVVEPAAGMITDKRLLVVADGALNYVPFEALVTSTETTDFVAAAYLVKSNEIVYAPSSMIGCNFSRLPGPPAIGARLADPVFNTRTNSKERSTAGQRARRTSRSCFAKRRERCCRSGCRAAVALPPAPACRAFRWLV
jgi:hypothetical protein